VVLDQLQDILDRRHRILPFFNNETGFFGSDRIHAGFARADPDRFFDGGYEDLPIPDPAGLCGPPDRLDGLFDHVVAEHNLDLHLGQKIHDVFRPAVWVVVPLLPAEALGFRDGDALKPHLLQRFLYLVEFERLDDGLDFFHSPRPWIAVGALRPRIAAQGLAVPMPRRRKRAKSFDVSELGAISTRLDRCGNARVLSI